MLQICTFELTVTWILDCETSWVSLHYVSCIIHIEIYLVQRISLPHQLHDAYCRIEVPFLCGGKNLPFLQYRGYETMKDSRQFWAVKISWGIQVTVTRVPLADIAVGYNRLHCLPDMLELQRVVIWSDYFIRTTVSENKQLVKRMYCMSVFVTEAVNKHMCLVSNV